MNFFERQAAARRHSKRLIVLFSLAVIAIVAAVDAAMLLVFGLGAERPPAHGGGLLVGTSLLTLAVIAVASLFRIASLRSGGAKVATELGGVPVPENTPDPGLRRLRNVIEEIAIASGVPVPQIFVLEDEAAINAFAAGYAPADAAVTVTRGALERLNRDELQGVIAHEFSHVLNGDMRLNIRLMGLLFGILVLALIGRKVLEHGRVRGKGAGMVLLVALAVMLVGYIGLFFGRVIKAGLSRQREYLADASAVQFTRQTRGIAGALKKIAGLAEGSKLAHRGDAEEVSHMLFGDGVGFSRLFATHPPLIERIRALEPAFTVENLDALQHTWAASPPSGIDEDRRLGLHGRIEPGLPSEHAELAVAPAAVVAQVGAPREDDYRRASAISEAIPETLQAAARSRDGAIPLVFGLLLGHDGEVRTRQLAELGRRHDAATANAARDHAGTIAKLHPMLRLPLAALAFPVLRRRPRPELEAFLDTTQALAQADGRIDVFEYCLAQLLRVQVREALDPSRHWRAGRRKLGELREQIAQLLAVLAQTGHDDAGGAQRAFNASMAMVLPGAHVPYAAPAQGVQALDAVWPELDRLDPAGKAALIEGLTAAIGHDGRIGVAEAELLRTVCAVLHCPLPPMLERGGSSRAATE